MSRKIESLKHFKENYTNKLHDKKIAEIKDYIKENQATIETKMIEAFKNLFTKIAKIDKEIAFITGCVLRTSIKNDNSNFLLSAYNDLCFLDKNTLDTYYKSPWLWDKLHDYQKEISKESKRYVGKITKIDIERIKWEKVHDYKALVIPVFRSAIEKAVQLEEYKILRKDSFLDIRIGEYYGLTESIWFENNIELPIEKVKPIFKPQNETVTTYKHYKNLDLSKGDYSNINFAYTRFENVDFSDSIMRGCCLTGTKFSNCNLTNIIF